jgi:hypothetical protein
MTLTTAGTLCTETITAKGRVIMITAMDGVTPTIHIVTVMIITLTTRTVVTITLTAETIISGLQITPYLRQNAAR